MLRATLIHAVSTVMVTVMIAANGPAVAYTITVDPLPTLTFPEKADPKTVPGQGNGTALCAGHNAISTPMTLPEP